MAVLTLNDHIILNADGFPIIKGTTVKVVEIVMDVKAHGWSPEEIHWQHPHLSMAQIHSALAYYWDHREQFEIDSARRTLIVDQIRSETQANSIRAILRKKGVN